jgi:hypothetical protein
LCALATKLREGEKGRASEKHRRILRKEVKDITTVENNGYNKKRIKKPV